MGAVKQIWIEQQEHKEAIMGATVDLQFALERAAIRLETIANVGELVLGPSLRRMVKDWAADAREALAEHQS